VESIIYLLGTKDFIRLKIGIGNGGEKIAAKEVVLKKFTHQEQEMLTTVIETSAQALDCLIQEGLQKAMNKYNR
jgi:PTH1 family peptidyl-tRNA hydrolase